ncbi:MAG: TIGR03118 family protein [Methylococcales bacterium]
MKNISRDSCLRFKALISAIVLCGVHFSLQADDQKVPSRYRQTNLVSNLPGIAAHTDANNLLNPWGIAFNPNGPVWIANNGSGTSTLYDGTGAPFANLPLITVSGAGDPTGIVFNSSNDFVVPSTNSPARFIFANESGELAAWSPPSNSAVVVTTPGSDQPIYKGLALGGNGTDHFLYVTDFFNAKVLVFDKTFTETILACSFSDPKIPVGFAPFGIQNINGVLYVTYAKQDANKEDDVAGPGHGYVNIFDADGCLIRRFASRGPLNSPWGIVLVPANFGVHSDQLLIGNFGDGAINSFSLKGGQFRGRLRDQNGQKISIDGLWGLAFGNGVLNQPTNTLFFTAGPNDEADGLYGKLEAVKD